MAKSNAITPEPDKPLPVVPATHYISTILVRCFLG